MVVIPFLWKGTSAADYRIHGVAFAIKNGLTLCWDQRAHYDPAVALKKNRLATLNSSYTPTLEAEKDIVEHFYPQLDQVLTAVPKEVFYWGTLMQYGWCHDNRVTNYLLNKMTIVEAH